MSQPDLTNINDDNIHELVKKYLHNEISTPINDWDVSNVTDMSRLFENATNFNEPLDKWDVSNVTNMAGMFNGAISFNQPLNSWNVSNVTQFRDMFTWSTASFKQPLNNWKLNPSAAGIRTFDFLPPDYRPNKSAIDSYNSNNDLFGDLNTSGGKRRRKKTLRKRVTKKRRTNRRRRTNKRRSRL